MPALCFAVAMSTIGIERHDRSLAHTPTALSHVSRAICLSVSERRCPRCLCIAEERGDRRVLSPLKSMPPIHVIGRQRHGSLAYPSTEAWTVAMNSPQETWTRASLVSISSPSHLRFRSGSEAVEIRADVSHKLLHAHQREPMGFGIQLLPPRGDGRAPARAEESPSQRDARLGAVPPPGTLGLARRARQLSAHAIAHVRGVLPHRVR
jgi:hypothetical protein